MPKNYSDLIKRGDPAGSPPVAGLTGFCNAITVFAVYSTMGMGFRSLFRPIICIAIEKEPDASSSFQVLSKDAHRNS